MSMKMFYWPGRERNGTLPVLFLKPLHPNNPIEVDDLEQWTADNWGEQKTGHCIMLVMGEWQDDNTGEYHNEQARAVLGHPQTGEVTAESMAAHLRRKMGGYGRARKWFDAICAELDRLGYSVDLIAMDFEWPKFTMSYIFYQIDENLQKTGETITMEDVIAWVLENGKKSWLPFGLDYDLLQENLNPFGGANPVYRMHYDAWNEQIMKWNGDAFDSVFGDTGRKWWGKDMICCNYHMSAYEGGRPKPRAQMIVNAPVGKYSSPCLYTSDSFYQYQSAGDPDTPAAKAAFSLVSTHPRDTVAWFLLPDHASGSQYHVTEESYADTVAFADQAGCRFGIGW